MAIAYHLSRQIARTIRVPLHSPVPPRVRRAVKVAEVEHGLRVTLAGGLLKPLARLCVVLRHVNAPRRNACRGQDYVDVPLSPLAGAFSNHSRALA